MIACKHVFTAQALVCLGVATASAGCGAAASVRLTDLARSDIAPMRIGETRVVDARVNPMVPVHLAAEGTTIAATFGLPGGRQVVTHLVPASLEQLSREMAGPSELPSAPTTGAARVMLEGGRFLVCWTRASADGGREAVAQMWSASGARIGAPMVISPPDADVFGSPRAATADGHHVIVTFPEATGESFELRAVSLEDSERLVDADPVARR